MRGTLRPNDPEKAPEVQCPALEPASVVHDNGWFRVLDRGGYFTIEYPRPQVVILPLVEELASVVLVRVNRPVIDDTPWELPAGDSAAGETPRCAAQRELGEETGVRIDDGTRFTPILPISEMPGRIPVLLSIFRVCLTPAEYEQRQPHDHEIVEVGLFSYSQIIEMVVAGEIYLSSPIAIIAREMFGRGVLPH